MRTPCQVVIQAMKTYGLILADNGCNWYFQGTTDKPLDVHDGRSAEGDPGKGVRRGRRVVPDGGPELGSGASARHVGVCAGLRRAPLSAFAGTFR